MHMLEKFLRLLFHPMTFAIGFLAPLISQSLIALNWVQSGYVSIVIGLLFGAGFGLMAMYRGSWIWIR